VEIISDGQLRRNPNTVHQSAFKIFGADKFNFAYKAQMYVNLLADGINSKWCEFNYATLNLTWIFKINRSVNSKVNAMTYLQVEKCHYNLNKNVK